MSTLISTAPLKRSNYLMFDLLNTPLIGRNLIEASAGTGKTYAISRLFLRLLLEKEIPVTSILVVTFTEAATVELRERIYRLLKEALTDFTNNSSNDTLVQKLLRTIPNQKGQSLLKNALNNFDHSTVYTIHGFCQRILTDYTFECGSTFGSTLITDQSEIVREIVLDFWRIHFYNHSSPCFINYLLQSGISPDSFIKLFDKFKNYSELRIIPQTAPADFKSDEIKGNALFLKLKSDWPQVRDTIEKLFQSKTLKATKYKDSTILKMILNMDQLCKKGNFDLLLFESFENFTPPVLMNYTKKDCAVIKHPFFGLCDEVLTTANQLCQKFDQQIEYLFIASLRFTDQKLNKIKSDKNVFYFDDLLQKVHQALYAKNNGDQLAMILANKYKAVLIDEFQDTDPIQYAIIKKIAPPESISFLIGDPKQAIYSFRGADILTYLSAAQDVTSKYSLNTNYRSDPGLLSAVNIIFNLSNNPFLFDQIQFRDSQAGVTADQSIAINGVKQKPLKVWFKQNDDSTPVPTTIAQEIYRLVSLGQKSEATIGTRNINPSNFAILIRTNDEAELYQNELSLLGISSVFDSNYSVFKTIEAKELCTLFNAIAEPSDARLINAALTLPFFGLSASEIESCILDINRYSSYLDQFSNYQTLWAQNGFEVMIQAFFNETHLRKKILGYPLGERKLTNYLHLAELIQKESIANNHRISSLIRWFAEKITNSSHRFPDEEIIRLESDEASVKIITIHKSKGLEFDIVFCPSMAVTGSDLKKEFAYVVHLQNNETALVVGPEEKAKYAESVKREILAENMRLLYVALTRSKSACYVVYANSDSAATSPFSYLLFGNDLSFPEVEMLKLKLKSLSENEIWQFLQKLNDLNSSISVEMLPLIATGTLTHKANNDIVLSCRQCTKEIPAPWRISSFSSLTHSRIAGESKFDEIPFEIDENQVLTHSKTTNLPLNLFDFPKGANAGTFLHKILELTDFSSITNARFSTQYIFDQMNLFGFDKKWHPILIELINTLADKELSTECDSLSLGKISALSSVREMEFYFPLKNICSENIIEIFSPQTDLFKNVYNGEGLHFSASSGFMKGFIDMVLEFKNKYYLIDWKSNYLGSNYEDYNTLELNRVMTSEHYTFQYHIYCIALHLYLKRFVRGYNYEKNFGGVFYLFLRGIADKGQTGIYFHRPEYRTITDMVERLIRI